MSLIQEKPLAILESKLDEINAFLSARLKENITAVYTDDKDNNNDKFKIIKTGSGNNIAVISVYGILSRRMNMITQFSGGTSIELLSKNIVKAIKSTDGIILDIDSPGGEVGGVMEAAGLIRKTSIEYNKPIIAYISDMGASGAYWLAAASDQIYISATASVGSIGVVTTHYDYSERNKQIGIIKTDVYSGKYKRIAGENKPLSKEGYEYLQEITDDIYTVFVKDIAKNRNISIDDALKMADGRIYIGQKAIDIGLAEKIVSSMDEVVEIIDNIINSKKDKIMDKKELQNNHPELYTEVFQDGVNSEKGSIDDRIKAETSKVREESVLAERKRCIDILSVDTPIEARIAAIKDGITVDQAYRKFFEAEKKMQAKALEDFEKNTEEPLEPVKPEKNKNDFMATAKKYQKDNDCSLSVAIQHTAEKYPELHHDFIYGKKEK